jgi:superoxide reductase
MATELKINKPADPKNLTDLEKKHIPVISSPEAVAAGEPFNVTVHVGSILHVMEEKHYIEWVELYLNDKKIGKAEFSPKDEKAEAVFKVEAEKTLAGTEGKLRALEHCNVHGFWEEFTEIKIQ